MVVNRSIPRRAIIATGNVKNNQIRRICLPEDMVESELEGFVSVNKCTLEIQSLDNPDFDYVKYEEFCYLKSLQFQVRRLRNERASKTAEKPLSNQPSEEFLKQLFVERYGPVDFEDPLMIKRLEVMKTSMVELATRPLDAEDLMNRFLDESIEGPTGEFWILNDQYADDFIESKIFEKFTPQEIEMFRSLKPADAGSDWFHLPRGDLSRIREQLPTPNGKISKRPLKHLSVYDPKFEFCFNRPYRIFNTCDKSGIEDLDIPKLTAFRILQHLNQFPDGVTRNVFWETFYEVHQKFIEIPDLPMFQIFDYLPKEVLIVPKSTIHPELIFPGFLEGVVDPQLILKRVWHAIMCVLSRRPYVEDVELMDRIENEFGFRFHPRHWEYNTVADFLRKCLELFGLQNVFIIQRITFLQNRLLSTKDYFCLKVPCLLKKMDELGSGLKCKRSIKYRPIPDDCAGKDYKVRHLADHIGVGECHVMELLARFSTSRMSYQHMHFRRDAAMFQKSLQEFPWNEQLTGQPQPFHSQLAAGMYVMVRHNWKALEWYRARIIWRDIKTKKYYVYGIDSGFLTHVELKNIKLMPLKIAEHVAYAVPIRLRIGRVTKHRKLAWEVRTARNILDDLMQSYYLKVEFQKSEESDALGCKKWTTTGTLVKRRRRRFLIEHMSLTIVLFLKIKEQAELAIAKEKAGKNALKENSHDAVRSSAVDADSPKGEVGKNKDEKGGRITLKKKEGSSLVVEIIKPNIESRMI